MTRKRFTEKQITRALRKAESGIRVEKSLSSLYGAGVPDSGRVNCPVVFAITSVDSTRTGFGEAPVTRLR